MENNDVKEQIRMWESRAGVRQMSSYLSSNVASHIGRPVVCNVSELPATFRRDLETVYQLSHSMTVDELNGQVFDVIDSYATNTAIAILESTPVPDKYGIPPLPGIDNHSARGVPHDVTLNVSRSDVGNINQFYA